MHPQPTHPTDTAWIGKAEAAAKLKVSVRTALALAKAGKIASRREMDPVTNQLAVRFDPVAVDRYAYHRDNPEPERWQVAKTAEVQPAAELQTEQRRVGCFLCCEMALPGISLCATHAALARQDVAIPPQSVAEKEAARDTPYIKIPEAAGILGLPVRLVLGLVRRGVLPAFRDTCRRELDSWYVHRDDVLALRPPQSGSKLE